MSLATIDGTIKTYVYVIEGGWKHEGSMILKIFKNEREADKYKDGWEETLNQQNFQEGHSEYDYITKTRVELS